MGRQGRQQLVIPFILPAFAVYTLFFIYPAGRALWVSLHDWSGFGKNMVYIGLDNYHEMLQDTIFMASLIRTLAISIAGGIANFTLALFFAAILQRKLKGWKFFRTLIFFPTVAPTVGIGLMWLFFYNNQLGPLSSFLNLVGLKALDQIWLGSHLFLISLTVAVVWTIVGYYTVLLMAGIEKIPQNFYEAAIIDGASEWKMFFTITVPMIWDVLVVSLVMWITGSLKIFDFIAAMSFPNPSTRVYTLAVYIWAESTGSYTPTYRLGYGTALGVVLLIIIVVLVALVRFVTRRESIEC